MIHDVHNISEIASAIGTSVAGKKAELMGILTVMATEEVTPSHAIIGTLLAMIIAAVSATLWGGNVKSMAQNAQAVAIEAKTETKRNHERAESFNTSLHQHAIEAEKRLGSIESDIRVIKQQNTNIIDLLKTHDKK